MLLSELHKRFIKEKTYLDNVTSKTILFYNQAWTAFTRELPTITTPTQLTGDVLNDFVFALRERKQLKVVSVNTYISGLNSFLAWLCEHEHTAEKLTIKKLKMDRTIPKVVSEASLIPLIEHKPLTLRTLRVHAVVCTVLDTGLRITEVLTTTPDDINIDELTIRVMGKGRKERVVPFSKVLRRVLVRYFHSLPAELLASRLYAFPTKDGGRMRYDNLRRDYDIMCQRELGIVRPGGFHRLRHTFATDYLKNGGNTRYLQNILGHSSIKTTEIYTHPDAESMRLAHTRVSPLTCRSSTAT